MQAQPGLALTSTVLTRAVPLKKIRSCTHIQTRVVNQNFLAVQVDVFGLQPSEWWHRQPPSACGPQTFWS